jgi:asparagine synthase (glutamine-hydrolysing)
MPGFAGYIGKMAGGEGFPLTMESMAGAMIHEAHHSADRMLLPRQRLGLGWVRDSETAGVVTGWNQEHDIFLLFNGEEFSVDGGVKSSVSNDGDPKACRIIRLYEEMGDGFLERLNGWFSGLLVDMRGQRAILFNDRFGQSRVYYSEEEGGMYFASEAKSLLKVLPRLRQVDDRGLAELLAVGCALQNRTIFKDVAVLPAGSAWVFGPDGGLVKGNYFDPGVWEEQTPLGEKDYQEQLTEVFSRVAPHYLNGGTKVGMSLTGGLDSRAILAWASRERDSLPCYTFGGPYRDCADVRIARRLALACGQRHSTIRVDDDFLGDFSGLAEKAVYVTDGSMDVSGAIELYVNKKAREIAPIRVTGNYGSEILRANVAFRPRKLDLSLFTAEFCSLLDEAAETYRKEATGNRLTFIAFKQVPWHHHARKAVEQSQLTVRSPFLDNELVALAYRAPRELETSPRPLLQLMGAGNPALEGVPTDRAYKRSAVPVFPRIARAWQEFTAKAEYAFDYGMPTQLSRIDHAVSRLQLERLFLGRHKFYHFRVWYKNQLGKYLEEMCVDGLEPSCYRPGTFKRLVREHLGGQDNHTLELHKALSVQLIGTTLLQDT